VDDETKNTSDQAATDDTEGYTMNILPTTSSPPKPWPADYDPTLMGPVPTTGTGGGGEPMPFPAPKPDPNTGDVAPKKDPVNS